MLAVTVRRRQELFCPVQERACDVIPPAVTLGQPGSGGVLQVTGKLLAI